MRIAPDEHVISDAEAIKTICGVNSDFTRVACSASDQNLQAAILQSDIYLPLQLPECQGDVAVGHHLQRARYPPKAEMIMTFMTSKCRHGERSLAAVIEPRSISTAIYHILRNPGIYETLQHEIDTAAPGDRLGSSHITYKEASQMPCLQVCMTEAARVHPLLGHYRCLGRHRHMDVQLAGSWVPGGSQVGVPPSVTREDPGVFSVMIKNSGLSAGYSWGAENMSRYVSSRTCQRRS